MQCLQKSACPHPVLYSKRCVGQHSLLSLPEAHDYFLVFFFSLPILSDFPDNFPDNFTSHLQFHRLLRALLIPEVLKLSGDRLVITRALHCCRVVVSRVDKCAPEGRFLRQTISVSTDISCWGRCNGSSRRKIEKTKLKPILSHSSNCCAASSPSPTALLQQHRISWKPQ